jgi:heptosyltransferase-2
MHSYDVADNADVNILFNYFPKQIDDAKTVLTVVNHQPKKKIYFDLLVTRAFIMANQCDLGNDGGAINMAKALKPSFTIFFSMD